MNDSADILGESYSKLNQLEKAEFYYRLALKAKPDHIPAHLTMAKLRHRQVRLITFHGIDKRLSLKVYRPIHKI